MRFVAVNPALCALLDRPEAARVGSSSAALTDSSQATVSCPLPAPAPCTERRECSQVQPDGSTRWTWLSLTGVAGPGEQSW